MKVLAMEKDVAEVVKSNNEIALRGDDKSILLVVSILLLKLGRIRANGILQVSHYLVHPRS